MHSFVIHAKTQAAFVLFGAGLWKDAHRYASEAAGMVLEANEDATGLAAYTACALVPAARGQQDEVADIIAQLEHTADPGPVAGATLDWVRAWAALSSGDHAAAGERLMSMRDSTGGWWAIGVEPMALMARELHYAGWPEMLPGLIRSLVADVPALGDRHGSILDYMRGFEAWSRQEPAAAMEHFTTTLRFFDAEPPLRPTQPAGESGGCRLYRALLGLDMATLLSEHPQLLRAHRSAVLELLVWAASLFQTCGAASLLAEATALMEKIRPRADAADGGAGSDQFALICLEEAARHPALSALSQREREIAVLVSRGSTNREVADELVISVRTVEYHVGNALSKLGLHSRQELRRLLREASR
ncbi:response regulator transcription factor [Nesterenkonia flava]|uniref:Helix-turn-helix transcriptional regulator n=1 Tax=Nesterenkonia flava TaxID=469799 RepID=A0ABU1FV84_9MICC|nr:helix-turn-helix transcriptional regulator [Nesterenkonia flava]MDR5712580.1 helix-turn-helix transcriptional regulator [Nesterenkonia flava]